MNVTKENGAQEERGESRGGIATESSLKLIVSTFTQSGQETKIPCLYL